MSWLTLMCHHWDTVRTTNLLCCRIMKCWDNFCWWPAVKSPTEWRDVPVRWSRCKTGAARDGHWTLDQPLHLLCLSGGDLRMCWSILWSDTCGVYCTPYSLLYSGEQPGRAQSAVRSRPDRSCQVLSVMQGWLSAAVCRAGPAVCRLVQSVNSLWATVGIFQSHDTRERERERGETCCCLSDGGRHHKYKQEISVSPQWLQWRGDVPAAAGDFDNINTGDGIHLQWWPVSCQ